MSSRSCNSSDVVTWESSLQKICGAFKVVPTDAHGLFIGDIAYRELAGIGFTLIRTNAAMMAGEAPSRNDVREIDIDAYALEAVRVHCYLVLQVQGESTVEQHGATVSLKPGNMVLVDADASCVIQAHGVMTHASVHIPLAALRASLQQGDKLFRKITTTTLGGRMLQDVIRHACHDYLQAFPLADVAPAPLEEVILSLLSTAWNQSPCVLRDVQRSMNTLPESDRWASAKLFVERHLHDARLGPDAVARHLTISRRQVHRLFEAHDVSPAQYIKTLRMANIARELRSPAFADQSITTLAYRWGFTDSANFSHAFKKAHRMTPRAYRRAAMTPS